MKARLEPATLKWAIRKLGYEMLSPVVAPLTPWGVGYNEGIADAQQILRTELRRIERQSKPKKLTPATTLCGPHERKAHK